MAEGFLDNIKEEFKAITGDKAKDKFFANEHTFPDLQAAQAGFTQAKKKLFAINAWSNLPGINSTFTLFDAAAQKTQTPPQAGFFIQIILPGVRVENWVKITDVQESDTSAQFTVHPCPNPLNDSEEVQHFFVNEASSTFKVELEGNTVRGMEIGKDEKINNHNYQAGARAFLNTLIAEGGWAGFQKLQWGKLTEYWVTPEGL